MNCLARNCPFCGSTNLAIDYTWHHYYTVVLCSACNAHGPNSEDGPSAIAAWNHLPHHEMVTLQVRVKEKENGNA